MPRNEGVMMAARNSPVADRIVMRHLGLVSNLRYTVYDGKMTVDVPAGYEDIPNGRSTTEDAPKAETHRRPWKLIHEGELHRRI